MDTSKRQMSSKYSQTDDIPNFNSSITETEKTESSPPQEFPAMEPDDTLQVVRSRVKFNSKKRKNNKIKWLPY
ncbi:hypothetical protein ACF0H5_015358 [Mactra antiquata]